jgi:hypothetical protein
MQALAMNSMAMSNMGGAVHLMLPEAPLSMAGDDVMTGALTAFEEVSRAVLVLGCGCYDGYTVLTRMPCNTSCLTGSSPIFVSCLGMC